MYKDESGTFARRGLPMAMRQDLRAGFDGKEAMLRGRQARHVVRQQRRRKRHGMRVVQQAVWCERSHGFGRSIIRLQPRAQGNCSQSLQSSM